jgi:hypothetical protein
MIDVPPQYKMSGDPDLLEPNSQFRVFPADEALIEHSNFHQQRFSDRSVGGAQVVLRIVIDQIWGTLREGQARDIDDRTPHQPPQMTPMGFFVILKKIFARKDVVVDEEDVRSFGLRDSEITRRRSALAFSMKNPEPVTDLELFQTQARIVGRPVVDDKNLEF